jgi:hypothetical protein
LSKELLPPKSKKSSNPTNPNSDRVAHTITNEIIPPRNPWGFLKIKSTKKLV